MSATWSIRRTVWGYSLFYGGELVASANRPGRLIDLAGDLS